MSEIIFIIKCIKCKTEFNQGDKSYRRICDGCRYDSKVAHRKRAHEKREIKREAKRKEKKKLIKICPVCGKQFEANHGKRVYCNNPCYHKIIAKVPSQIERTENNLIKLDERIIKVNEMYEEKMNKLQEQLDYFNTNAEKQRTKYIKNMERLQLIQHKREKEIAI